MIKFKKRWIAFWTSVLMVFLLSFPIAVISSDYFDYTTDRLSAGQRARASTMNSIFDEISAGFDLFPDVATLNAYFAAIAALSSGSGAVVSANDTTTGYLNGKLIVGDGIDFTENNDGGNETMTIAVEVGTAINAGMLELATDGETVTGVDTARATTPANITAKMAAPGAIGETTPNTIKLTNVGLKLLDTNASHVLIIKPGTDLSANHTLTVTTGDADRTITLSGNPTMGDYFDQAVKVASAPTFGNLTVDSIGVIAALRGSSQRPMEFRFVDGDEIIIEGGSYHISVASEKVVYWLEPLTFKLQSAGSNAGSEDYGVDGWHYIYLDDSAITTHGSTILDAGCFMNSKTAPTWDAAKLGWYNAGGSGYDRCIFAVYETGGVILEFMNSGDFVSNATPFYDLAATNIDTDWSDEVTLTMPSFTQRAKVTFVYVWVDATESASWRTEATTATTGHIIGTVETGKDEKAFMATDVITSQANKIDVKDSGAATNTLRVDCEGWYFSNGM